MRESLKRNILHGLVTGAIGGLLFGGSFQSCTCHPLPEARAKLHVKCGDVWLEGDVKGDVILMDAIVDSLDGNILGRDKPVCTAHYSDLSRTPTY